MLAYNKHLLFNIHGTNMKVINVYFDFLYDVCLKYFLFEEELNEM